MDAGITAPAPWPGRVPARIRTYRPVGRSLSGHTAFASLNVLISPPPATFCLHELSLLRTHTRATAHLSLPSKLRDRIAQLPVAPHSVRGSRLLEDFITPPAASNSRTLGSEEPADAERRDRETPWISLRLNETLGFIKCGERDDRRGVKNHVDNLQFRASSRYGALHGRSIPRSTSRRRSSFDSASMSDLYASQYAKISRTASTGKSQLVAALLREITKVARY